MAQTIEVATKSGYHHGDLRSQLLEAVRQLVEAKGPDGFSIAEAGRLAGVSSAAPYKHFKDKPAILNAVVLRAMERMAENMRSAIAEHPVGSIDRINAIGQTYINFAKAEPGMFRLIFGMDSDTETSIEKQEMGRQVFGIVIKVTADFLQTTPDDPEAIRRAYMLWVFVHGHSFLAIDGKSSKAGAEIDEQKLLSDVSQAVLVNISQLKG